VHESARPIVVGRQFPVDEIRRQFPSLERVRPFVFFDNAAGAQIPSAVLEAVTDHLLLRNVQRGGPYRQSREVDAMIARARACAADLVHAWSPDEIAFGLNATSFIRAISLAIGQTIAAGRAQVVVSELDHEANIATWLGLERFGARIAWWRTRDDGRLHASDLESLLTRETRVVACAMASNATGSRVDVAAASTLAHAAGAEMFVDAVHFAPHGPIDVRTIGCDYLVCSGYKMFAPHMGFAWCRREAINALPTFREHFIPDRTPDKLEAGTYVYENVAGLEAAIEYLEQLGRRVGFTGGAPVAGSRRDALESAMNAIAGYEQTLSRALIEEIGGLARVGIHGITSRDRLNERVPTLAFTVDGVSPGRIADGLAARNVGVRSGHMYSPRLLGRLGLSDGVVRASLVHYNTVEEIQQFRDALNAVIGENTE
jgi:cysteine desulfurase family protein (TIGR01976 family)